MNNPFSSLQPYQREILALPAPATIPIKKNRERRWHCHRNRHGCSISQQKTGISFLRVQACEDDCLESFDKPFLDITIHHLEGFKHKGYETRHSENLYEVKTDRLCTLQEVKELAEAMLEACKYLPQDGTPKI